jgi:hypothetical protein
MSYIPQFCCILQVRARILNDFPKKATSGRGRCLFGKLFKNLEVNLNELNAGRARSLHFDYIWIRLANRKTLTRLINSVGNYLVLESESLKRKTGTRERLTIYSRMNDIFKLSRNFSSLQVSGRTDSV